MACVCLKPWGGGMLGEIGFFSAYDWNQKVQNIGRRWKQCDFKLEFYPNVELMGECQTGHVWAGPCQERVGRLMEQTQISQSARHTEINLKRWLVIVSICIYPGLFHWIKVVAVRIRLVNCWLIVWTLAIVTPFEMKYFLGSFFRRGDGCLALPLQKKLVLIPDSGEKMVFCVLNYFSPREGWLIWYEQDHSSSCCYIKCSLFPWGY